MRIKLITIAALLSLAACSEYEGQIVPSPSPGSVILSERLSNQRVNAFAEDREGHIWIATFRGLNKYTVNQFQQFFCTDDLEGLPDNQINSVLTAQDGTLWVATVFGVARLLEDGSFQRVQIMSSNRMVNWIQETRDGTLLFYNGTELLRYDSAKDQIIPVIREFAPFAYSLVLSGDGKLWTLKDGGFTLSACSTSTYTEINSVRIPFQAYHICEAGNGDLWLSGMGSLGILDTSTMQWKELPEAIRKEKRLMGGDIDILFAPESQEMLMNVIGTGFFLYNNQKGTVTFQDDPLFPFDVPRTEVRTIFKDSRGNLWFGTTDQGFTVANRFRNMFKGNKFLQEEFKGKTVTSLCPDKAGQLWIATLRDGLYCYETASRKLHKVDDTHLFQDTGVGYVRTTKVFCDSAGDLWLLFPGKMSVVQCRYKNGRLTPLNSISVFIPMSIAEDDQGYIWIGGFSSTLVRYGKKDKSVTPVQVAAENEWTFVTDLLMEEPGKLLAGCFNRPPVVVNTYTLDYTPVAASDEEMRAKIRRSVIYPTKLLKDSAGNYWFGTVANGIILSDGQTGGRTSLEGLPCADICSMEEDRQGNIWVSTMNGLAKYDRTTGSFVHYFETDGTGGNQYSDRASCILPDGTLVFGGTHGLTWFNPLDAPAKRTVPLVFEYLTIHGNLVKPAPDGPIDRMLCLKPEVTIRHNQNAFNISFSALDYSDFEQIRYAYMLEGFDKDWVRINTLQDAYFANLPPGRYKFKVRIANASHTLTDIQESLDIRVLPPWYQSWWAIILWILLGCFLIGVVYTFYRHIHRARKEAAKRIREVLREREKAEEAEKAEKALNKIQMDYFSNVAHEFRTPLTMIAGPARQLSSSAGIKGQDRQLVEIIRRNSAWMLSLVNQLLDFNRIGNSKLQMKVAKIDIVEPLKDSASLFRFNAESKGIELTTYGLEEPFTMWADADKVQKVVMNLLSNALKFTPLGGKVSLSFDVISRADAASRFPLTDADKDGQYACISVSDSGAGIDEDQLEKIFERFYQTASGKKATGSGIGLYYARALCTLHHGYIKAWNQEGGGALFSLILPISASSYTEDERTSEAPQLQTHALAESITADTPDTDAHKRHIAVVDDDIDIANYLKVLLKPEYKVSLYFDGASALKGMAEDAPDLVISDVIMPGMDGYQLCEAIKGDLQLSHIPVVLVTAKVAVESQVQGLGKGADAYVTKPFQPEYLMALVKSLLDNREKIHRQLGSVTTTEEIAPEALSPRDAAFMKDLYELMEKELANADLDIVKMAEMMKISRTKFYYKVKGLTGENPSVFFKRYKLNRAATLLKEGKYNMSEIAWMTGFNTLSRFSTSFKKQFGVPPSEYQG